MKLLILSFFFASTIGFAQQSLAWTVSVKGPHFDYQIEFSKKNFAYKDTYIQKNWPVKTCNKKVFEKVVKDFHAAFKKRIVVKGKFPDQIAYQEDKKSVQIAQNSPFGIFLTQFPNRVINLMTAEEQACKVHRK